MQISKRFKAFYIAFYIVLLFQTLSMWGLEGQLKAESFTSRLLFAFNATDDRKVQRAIDQVGEGH